MDVPKNILSKLICSRCENYLKSSPVYLTFDAKAVCGTCLDPEDEEKVSRNEQYELLAQAVKFPCKYQKFGCSKSLFFDKGTDHVASCLFKQFVCPILESGKCGWLGTRSQILKHCEDKHPDNLLKNPCTLTHDITKTNSQTYLINAFLNIIFLLHTRVNITNGKIYHCVRFLGSPSQISIYNYSLKIRRNDLEISKSGKVASEGRLVLQENASLILSISSLLDFLDRFDDTTFSLSIKRMCKNRSKGCTYMDIPIKTSKHEQYFCDNCIVCKNFAYKAPLVTHYCENHFEFMQNAGSLWVPKGFPSRNNSEVCFIRSEVGTLICKWENCVNDYAFRIYAPITTERLLDEYKCVINTNITACKTFTADVKTDTMEEWIFYVPKNLFQEDNFRIAICIEKININRY